MLLAACIVLISACSGSGTQTPSSTTSGEQGTTTPKNNDAAEQPTAAAPQNVEWMIIEFGPFKYTNDLAVYQLMEQAGNIDFTILPSPIDAYVEKFNITLASLDIPDVISLFGGQPTLDAVNEYGPKGLFVPISDHYDKLPNFKKFVDKYPVSAQAITASDGKIYVLPGIRDYTPANQGFGIREDLLNKNNIQLADIKTTDDLYHALTVLKQELGGPVMSARSGISNMSRLAQMFGTAFQINFYSDWDKQYINVFNLPNTKDAVIFMNNMFKDGLLHPDWASMTDQEWSQGIGGPSQYLGFYADNMQNLDASNRALLEAGATDKPLYGWGGLLPPAYNGKVYPWAANLNFSTDWGKAISAQTEALDGILTAFDYAYDLNNVDKFVYGVEGESYKLREDGTPEYLYDQETPEGAVLAFEQNGYGQNQAWALVFRETEYFDWARNPKGAAFERAALSYKNVYTFNNPPIQLTADETEQLKNLKTPFDTFVNENLVKFINGQRPISEWEAFVQEANGTFKADQIVAIYNGALARLQ